MLGQAPLDFLSDELNRRYAYTKPAIQRALQMQVPHGLLDFPLANFSELALVASPLLSQRLQSAALDLCSALQPRFLAQNCIAVGWPFAVDADVLTVDYAIAHSASDASGWSLRLVEFQAFTSLLMSAKLIQEAHASLFPELSDHLAWQSSNENWELACQAWLAGAEGSVLLEQRAYQRPTTFDLILTAHRLGLSIVEPTQLLHEGSRLFVRNPDGSKKQIHKILNRLILDELDTHDPVQKMLRQANLDWHNHPAWYRQIQKGVQPELKLRQEPPCVLASDWRSLGLPASELVAKPIFSYGGAGILFAPEASTLDHLARPEHYLVQRRFQAYPIMQASDGADLYAEIRLIIRIKSGLPWIAMQFARVFRGQRASASQLQGLPGEGMTVLYNVR